MDSGPSIPDGASRARRKVWQLLPHDAAAIDNLGRALRVSPIVAQLLINRQIVAHQVAEKFLACPMSGLDEP